jgi:hypothetical protein
MSKRPDRSQADRIDDSAPSMRSERPAWCSQEHVIIVGAGERADGNETIAAGTILDDDRLAPAPAQSVRNQSRADIDTAAGSERQDELDRALRPNLRRRRLRRRWLYRQHKHGEKAEGDAKCETLHAGSPGITPA